MMLSFFFTYSLLVILAVYWRCTAGNRVSPPTKVIQLTLAISKATYLPLSTKRFIKNGRIVENPSTTKSRSFFGLPLPARYDAAQDKTTCDVGGWTAKSYKDKETEVLMFKNKQQKLVVFGFRGTEPANLLDWKLNFHFKPFPSTIGKTRFFTHAGFKFRYNFVASWFEKEYSQVPWDFSIVLTGHSLGGAEASIAAVYAAGKLKRRPDAVVTYGSPLVGTQSFKNYYNQAVGCDRTLRITAKGDIIPGLPNMFGYRHVCYEIKVDGASSVKSPHNLYDGYEKGLKRMSSRQRSILFGCNVVLN